MLKKRILASSMASVMALTSVCAVAFADDSFDTSKAVVTKAELQTYIESKEIKELVDGKIDDYGSISGANFLKAYEFAQKVVDGEYDNENNGIDYATVAYQMVKAEKDNLKQYTAAQLSNLVAAWKATYDTENKLNAINDLKYYEGGWNDFVDAWESADNYKTSDDIRVTTDQYEELYDKASKLTEMPTVTKSKAESAKAAFEKALATEYKYQPWMRGTVSGSGTDFDGKTFTWGALFATIESGADAVQTQYNNFDAIKEVSVTSNEAIVKAVSDMDKAAKVLNGFSGTLDSGSETKSGSLLKKYHGQLVYTYNTTDAAALYDALSSAVTTDKLEVYNKATATAAPAWAVANGTSAITAANAWNVTTGAGKTISAELKIRIKSGEASVFAIVTKDKIASGYGKIVAGSDTNYFYDSKANAEAQFPNASDYETVEFKAGSTYVLSDYVDVTSVEVLATEGTDISTQADALQDAKDELTDAEGAKTTAKNALDAAVATAVSGGKTITISYAEDGTVTVGGADASDVDTEKSAYTSALSNVATKKAAVTSAQTAYNTALASSKAAAKTKTHAELNGVFDGKEDSASWPTWSFETAGFTAYAATNDTKTTYTNSNGDTVPNAAGLALAITLYDEYKAESYAGITDIDSIKTIVGDPKGSGAEWKLIYNYLNYSLTDLFEASATALHTKSQVDALIEKAYKLTETTVETSLFNPSHMDLVDVRQEASDWSKAVSLVKPYKDNESTAKFFATANEIADNVYNALEGQYNQLNNELAAFKYSYEDIAKDMVRAAKSLEAKSDKNLAEALADVAAALTEVEVVRVGGGYELTDSEAFSADGTFNYHNRLFTGNGGEQLATDRGTNVDVTAVGHLTDDTYSSIDSASGYNATHGALNAAYKKMLAILDGELKGDADLNGTVAVADATLALKHTAKVVTLDGTAFTNADVDGNGTIDVADATAILKIVAENAGK